MYHRETIAGFEPGVSLGSGVCVRARGAKRRECRGNFFFFFTLVTGPRRSLSLKLSDIRVYEPQIRARLGTTAHFCEVVTPRVGEMDFMTLLTRLRALTRSDSTLLGGSRRNRSSAALNSTSPILHLHKPPLSPSQASSLPNPPASTPSLESSRFTEIESLYSANFHGGPGPTSWAGGADILTPLPP